MRGILGWIGGREITKTCQSCGEPYVDDDMGRCPKCGGMVDSADRLREMIRKGVIITPGNNVNDKDERALGVVAAALILGFIGFVIGVLIISSINV